MELALAGDGGDQDADRGADERARVPHRGQALGLNEHRHLGRELGEVSLHFVLQNKPRQRSRGVILGRHLGEDVDEIVVEVWILIELL